MGGKGEELEYVDLISSSLTVYEEVLTCRSVVAGELLTPSLERVQALYLLAQLDFEDGESFRSKVRRISAVALSSQG